MLLLDTHVAVWVAGAPDRLGRGARDVIERSSPVYLSAISLAELEVKGMLGKVRVPDGFADWMADQGIGQLQFTATHAVALRRFGELVRHDPFDRMLLAQAVTDGLSLLTADVRLLGLGRDWIIDATE
jgi:PIN domain nuclease of toxin-antitoxin system